jgi:hypothetical protein
MSRKKKGRFTSLHKTPFESTVPPHQQPAGKTTHGKAREKMLREEEARIRREREEETPKPPSDVAGMAMGLTVGGRSVYAGMVQAMAGITDLTKESHPPIDLTDVPASLHKPDKPEVAVVPALTNAATEQQQQKKGGADVAHPESPVSNHNAEE